MSVEFYESHDGKVLWVRASGKLTTGDYERFVPEFERLIERHGEIRIAFEARDFHGWEAGALWEDAKLIRHYHDIERFAVVGEKRWEEWMSKLCKVFTKADVRFYALPEADQARAWLEEGL